MTDATLTDEQRLDSYCPSWRAPRGALCHTGSGKVLAKPHNARGKARQALSQKPPKGVSKATRLALIQRSGGWCEACPVIDPGSPKHAGEDPHHRLRRSQGGSDDPDNLVWTCRRGHRLIHDGPARAYELGLLERSSR